MGFLETVRNCNSNDHLYWVQGRNLADPSHHQTAHHTRCSRSAFSAGKVLKFLISLVAVIEKKALLYRLPSMEVILRF
jgi:hypothetical protein